MASKIELATEINELAATLKRTDIVTEGLNHVELTDLLSDLKAKQRDAELKTQADDSGDQDEGDLSPLAEAIKLFEDKVNGGIPVDDDEITNITAAFNDGMLDTHIANAIIAQAVTLPREDCIKHLSDNGYTVTETETETANVSIAGTDIVLADCILPTAIEETDSSIDEDDSETGKTGDDETGPSLGDETLDEQEESLPPYTMAEGKSITSRRGIRGPGAEVKAEDLPGGIEAIEAFVKSGHIVKN